ncbi:MAG: hypothetical protein ACYCOU_20650 [Sulfobacillus sp.]
MTSQKCWEVALLTALFVAIRFLSSTVANLTNVVQKGFEPEMYASDDDNVDDADGAEGKSEEPEVAAEIWTAPLYNGANISVEHFVLALSLLQVCACVCYVYSADCAAGEVYF